MIVYFIFLYLAVTYITGLYLLFNLKKPIDSIDVIIISLSPITMPIIVVYAIRTLMGEGNDK